MILQSCTMQKLSGGLKDTLQSNSNDESNSKPITEMVQYLRTGLPNQSLLAVQICPFHFCKSSQLLVDAFQHMQHPPLRHTCRQIK